MTLPFALTDAHTAHKGTALPADVRGRLEAYDAFVRKELEPVAFEVDHRARPYIQAHDTLGGDPEAVVLNPSHRAALAKIYASGLSTGPVEGRHPWWETFALGYLTTDIGCFCSATVTMATAFSLVKYGTDELRSRFLATFLEGGGVRQGATWATEAQGGSDLGSNRATARATADGKFLLNGEKYFCSNVGAEFAVVTARPDGAPEGPRGVRLFFVPSKRSDGRANWRIRRLKEKMGTVAVPTGEVSLIDSEGFLLGKPEEGLYPTMEMLNVSRVCNAVGSAGVLHQALRAAMEHAGAREAFGKRLVDHPLMAIDLAKLAVESETASLLAFDPAFALDAVWKDRPPKTPGALLFRFATHAAKLVTADQAIRGSYAAMEILGGPGYLEEYPVAKLVRDAMVVPIWEGGANRQAIDAWEISTRAHPERPWLEEASKARDSASSDMVRSFLDHRIQVALAPGGGEVSAKPRLQAIAEMRQMTLLERLGKNSAEAAAAARARSMTELFALMRDTRVGTDIPLILAMNALGTLR